MKTRLLFVLIFSTYIQNGFSQIGGSGTYKFLDFPASARVAALGGHHIAVKDNDINLAIDNPALLNKKMDNQLAFNYINYFADITLGYAGYAKTIENVGTFSGGIRYINYGSFLRTQDNGDIVGDFKAGEYALQLGWGREIGERLSTGVNFKTIYSSFERNTSLAMALDLAGLYYDEESGVGVAIQARNVGRQVVAYRKGNREQLIPELQAGFSKKLQHAPFRFSLVYRHINNFWLVQQDTLPIYNPVTGEEDAPPNIFFNNLLRHFVVGVEVLPTKNFNIRLGYNIQRGNELRTDARPGMVGFTWGFGFRISKFQLSYGRASYHLAGASNHFTINTSLSSFFGGN
jgi:hypothetical protein